MAKIPKKLQLTSAAIENLMATETRCRIATIGPGTDINLTPMTFGWADGKVFIFGRGQKVANLRRNPQATVLVDVGAEWFELQGIMMHGQARVLETQEEEALDPNLAKAQLNLGHKHGLVEAGQTKAYAATAAGNSRRWIVFTPTNVVSWDNQQLKSKA